MEKWRRRWLLLLAVVALHGLGGWVATRPAPKNPQAAEVAWIQAVDVRPTPAQVVPRLARRSVRPSMATVPAIATSQPRGAEPVAHPEATVSNDSLTAPEPTPRAPALDLSQEALGRAAGAVNAWHDRPGMQSWRTDRPEASGATRLSESTGASGSRVTRVETGWSTWCIRTSQPGRPQAPGAGPELSLPTNCPQ